MAHAGGRPNEYENKYIEEVNKYLDLCNDEDLEFHKTRGDSSNSFERRIKVKLPTLEGFAGYLGVATKSLLNWEKENEEFLLALDKIRDKQKEKLISMSLAGEYNATIAKLMLSSNHGMREGSDVTTNGKELPIPLLHALRNNNSNEENL